MKCQKSFKGKLTFLLGLHRVTYVTFKVLEYLFNCNFLHTKKYTQYAKP